MFFVVVVKIVNCAYSKAHKNYFHLTFHTIKVKWVKLLSRVQLFVTPWTVGYQPPLSMGFPRQEYWSGLPCPPPRDLPDSGIKPASPASPALQVHSLLLSHWVHFKSRNSHHIVNSAQFWHIPHLARSTFKLPRAGPKIL